MNNLFYNEMLRKIRERRSIFVDRLLSGDIETAEEYKFAVGRIKGFDESEAIIVNLFKSLNV